MLTNLYLYKASLTRVFLLIYICGTFHTNAYDIVHFCLHLDDILSNEYVVHNHNGSSEANDIAHNHHILLDQLTSDPTDDDSDQVPASDDNLNFEIVQDISYLPQVCLSSEMHNYQYCPTIRYLENTLPPPKINDEFLV
jgi:hypothetical protein